MRGGFDLSNPDAIRAEVARKSYTGPKPGDMAAPDRSGNRRQRMAARALANRRNAPA